MFKRADKRKTALRMVRVAVIAVTLLCTISGLSDTTPAIAAPTPDQQACVALAKMAGPGLKISSAEFMPAGTRLPPPPPMMGVPPTPPLPAHCLVRGVLSPRTGVDGVHYGMGFEMRLPADWNGRFLFQGGGGTDGMVLPAIGATATDGPPALVMGYAVISSDGGHEGMGAGFAQDPQAKLDFAYAGLGKVASLGKTLIAKFYGRAARFSYFVGCSNGGREAMMAAQRFPTAFDGVVAGDPGFNLSAAAIAEMWSLKHLYKIAPKDKDGKAILSQALSNDDLKLVAQSVVADCDALDGLKDGFINNMAACRFNPKTLACKSKGQSGCLSKAKLAAIEAIFRGPHDSHGKALYASWPYGAGIDTMGWRIWKLGMSPTSTPNAIDATMGLNAMRFYFLTPPDPKVSSETFDFDTAIERTAKTAAIDDVTGDMSAFAQRGGKLILYHGQSDPVFSPNATIGWYRKLPKSGGAPQRWARLFLVPGMNHCGGGPATDRFNALRAIQEWVEKGRAPDRIVAHSTALPGVGRPLCPYPKFAKYRSGDVSDPKSFVCSANAGE